MTTVENGPKPTTKFSTMKLNTRWHYTITILFFLKNYKHILLIIIDLDYRRALSSIPDQYCLYFFYVAYIQ